MTLSKAHRETLAFIALKPRRVLGLAPHDFYNAQSLQMRGLIEQFQIDKKDNGFRYCRITDAGLKALARAKEEDDDLRRRTETVPPPPDTAA